MSTTSRTITNLLLVATLIGVLLILWLPTGTFSNDGFMPHGHCYLWTPTLVWTMVSTDALIGLSYVSISICLAILVRKIRLPFSAMFLAFGAFIAACGFTHFMSIYTLWYPNYWLDALVKVITALASVATAILIIPLIPKISEFATAARLSAERKKQLEELNHQLEERTESLVAINNELEAFCYSVSHDLRTPLRGIDGFSDALLEEYGPKLDEQGREYLGYVRGGAQRMGQIIDDLLNLSRITRTQMRSQVVNLSAIANETFAHLRQQEPARQIETVAQNDLMTQGDPGLIRIVLENLISNAWKFTSKISDARIEFGTTLKDGQIIYFVRDNGVGFEMEFANKLFSAFQRLHSAEDYAGTGIGLATAKRIVDRHGGTIRAEAKPNQGATIYFTLGGN